jgi:hypothetical protein
VIKTSAQFIAGFRPPNYILDGILQGGFLYSLSEAASEEIAKAKVDDEKRVLEFINLNPKASQASIATAMGWSLYNGEPNKMKASRCIAALVKDKLVKKTRGRFQVTAEGKKALNGGEDEEDDAAA